MLIKTQINMQMINWFNFDEPMNSESSKVELYLQDIEDVKLQVICLKKIFFEIFQGREQNIYVTQEKMNVDWGGLPIDVWVMRNDEFVLDTCGELSPSTYDYLTYLDQSSIEYNYQGVCKCNDWKGFLDIIITGVLKHIFTYSPKILDVERNIVFYFHHSGSIGIYFKDKSILSYLVDIAGKLNLDLQIVKTESVDFTSN